MEPKDKEYGPLFNSGRIVIACVRGNEQLISAGKHIGSKMLRSGIVVGVDEKIQAKSAFFNNKKEAWNRDFHNYTLIWKPGMYHKLFRL